MAGPVLTLGGHMQAVRRVKCDPYHGNMIASCSYDFTVRWGEFPNSVSIATQAHNAWPKLPNNVHVVMCFL